jgi:NAD-dependent deacetylase
MLERAAQILRSAKHPMFLSGAGISAESGIPTFRGADGLWKNFRAEDLATPEAFKKDPDLVWQWYNWRKDLISEKEPNPAHEAVAVLLRKLPGMLAITQNVDGFHQRAGATKILEMHGNIFRARCMACGHAFETKDPIMASTPCPACSTAALRPDVVWFGEALPAGILHAIHERLMVCDAILVVGTSGSVYPAAGFAIEVRRREGHVIEINPDQTHQPYAADLYMRGKAGDMLPKLVELI